MSASTFTLGEVLTALTGRLLCSIEGLYRVLNFLTGESLYTHQLPRAFGVYAPFVAVQHPDLAAIDWSGVNTETWRDWLSEQEARFGTTRELTPIPSSAYERQDPIAEAVEMMGGDARRVIAIDAEGQS